MRFFTNRNQKISEIILWIIILSFYRYLFIKIQFEKFSLHLTSGEIRFSADIVTFPKIRFICSFLFQLSLSLIPAFCFICKIGKNRYSQDKKHNIVCAERFSIFPHARTLVLVRGARKIFKKKVRIFNILLWQLNLSLLKKFNPFYPLKINKKRDLRFSFILVFNLWVTLKKFNFIRIPKIFQNFHKFNFHLLVTPILADRINRQ